MTLKKGFGKCSFFVSSANGWKDQNMVSSFSRQRNPNMEKAFVCRFCFVRVLSFQGHICFCFFCQKHALRPTGFTLITRALKCSQKRYPGLTHKFLAPLWAVTWSQFTVQRKIILCCKRCRRFRFGLPGSDCSTKTVQIAAMSGLIDPWWTSETGLLVSQITMAAVKIVPNWFLQVKEHGTIYRVM